MQGAILHDTVEDTDTTLDEIEEKFGPEVRSIVDEVSDDKSLPKAERKRLQVEAMSILVFLMYAYITGYQCTTQEQESQTYKTCRQVI